MLVDAAGAWADELAALAGVAPLGLVPKRRTAILFEPSTLPDAAWPLVLDADEQFYFKPESGLLLGRPPTRRRWRPAMSSPRSWTWRSRSIGSSARQASG